MKLKNRLLISLAIIGGLLFSFQLALASEVSGNLGQGLESGLTGSVTNCNPLTISNGTISAYPGCSVTCNSGYTLSGGACVSNVGGGGGGGGGGSSTLYCDSVTYSPWQACSGTVKFRTALSQSPSGCTLTATQQIALSATCSPTDLNGGASPANATKLIKKDGLSTLYYLGTDGRRYVFPHENVFFSWYKDFSGVVTVSAEELASYPLGGNIVIRPGTKLIKIVSDPSVYAVEPNGVLRKIQSEADAVALYGTNWAKRVVDVADSFFTNYTIGANLAAGEVPVGSVVSKDGLTYYKAGNSYRAFASDAVFNAHRLYAEYKLNLPMTGAVIGSTIASTEDTLVNPSQK